ncbi:MAG: hypothetical protein EOP45_21315 [Sphingobacteriaceae bacterium]|nr:MAG: hypothetical protein EOP45_21315 [Sphingobacteriaceae bacterium]
MDIETNKMCPVKGDTNIQVRIAPGIRQEQFYCDNELELHNHAGYWDTKICGTLPTKPHSEILFGYKNIHILCYNQNITFEGRNYSCPDYPFSLSPTDSFIVGTFNWTRQIFFGKQMYDFDHKERALRHIQSEIPAFEIELLDMNKIELKKIELTSYDKFTFTFLTWLEQNWFSLVFLVILLITLIFLLCRTRTQYVPTYTPAPQRERVTGF